MSESDWTAKADAEHDDWVRNERISELEAQLAEQDMRMMKLLELNRDICDALRSETEAFDFHVQSGGKTQPGYTPEVWKRNRWHIRPVGPDEKQR